MRAEAKHKTKSEPEARPLAILNALPPDAYLNPEEVRIYSHLKSRQAVYNWLKDETDPLPATKRGGWKILKRDLDAYLMRKHNRRGDDQPEHNTSDQALRRPLGLLIEIGKASLEWKRAGAMLLAAGETLDLEFIEQRNEDFGRKNEHLKVLLESVSERMLTRLRFMLPSIHSDLALPDEPPDELDLADGEAGFAPVNVAESARSRR